MKIKIETLIALVVAVLITALVWLAIAEIAAHGQERPRVQGNTVRLEVQGRQGDPNLPAARLAEWLRAVVVVSPEVPARYVVRLGFTGFDTQIKPVKTSIGRETGAATANIAIQAIGQAVAGVAYRHGGQVAGSVGGTAAQTAAQQVQNEIRYGTSKTGIVQLQYQLCLGPRCEVGKSTAYFRVQMDMDQNTQWARFAVLSVGNDRKKLQILQPSLYLGEGNQSSQQDFMQQALLELLLNEANVGWPRLVGRAELETLRGLLHPQPQAAVEAEPVTKRQRPAEEDGRVQQLARQVAELQAEVERLKAAQPKITMDLPPQPTPTPVPKSATGCINCVSQRAQPVAPPFVTLLAWDKTKPDVTGREVRLLLYLLVNDKKVQWQPGWCIRFGPNASAALKLWQSENGLPATGQTDVVTRLKLNEWYGDPAKAGMFEAPASMEGAMACNPAIKRR